MSGVFHSGVLYVLCTGVHFFHATYSSPHGGANKQRGTLLPVHAAEIDCPLGHPLRSINRFPWVTSSTRRRSSSCSLSKRAHLCSSRKGLRCVVMADVATPGRGRLPARSSGTPSASSTRAGAEMTDAIPDSPAVPLRRYPSLFCR